MSILIGESSTFTVMSDSKRRGETCSSQADKFPIQRTCMIYGNSDSRNVVHYLLSKSIYTIYDASRIPIEETLWMARLKCKQASEHAYLSS